MRKSKRTLLLAGALCMALLAGCGGGSETSGTGTAVSEEQGTRPREEAGAKDELVFVNYRDIRDLRRRDVRPGDAV